MSKSRTLDDWRICSLFLEGWSVARIANAAGYADSVIEDILRKPVFERVKQAMWEEVEGIPDV